MSEPLTQSAPLPALLTDAIRDMCQGYIDRQQIAGISACIEKDGVILFRENFGFANLTKQQRITNDTIFRVYSMSKPVTVVAALMLWEEGKFRLDDPIAQYLPAFSDITRFDAEGNEVPCRNPITIRQLMNMTSGMGYDYQETEQGRRYQTLFTELLRSKTPFNTIEFANHLATVPLLFEPGTDHNYSWSLDIVGALVEAVSGQTLADFMAQRIFKPLGMSDTGFYVPKEKHSRFAELYFWQDGRLQTETDPLEIFTQEPSFYMGGGGLVSTVDDYRAFMNLLLDNGNYNGVKLLEPETVQMMRSNQLHGQALATFQSGRPGYGYGYGVRSLMHPTESGLAASVGEFGWDGAASTWMGIDPVRRTTAVFMIQLMPYCCFPAQQEFQRLMYQAVAEIHSQD